MVISPKRNQEQYGMRGITGVRPSDRVTRFERTYGTRSVEISRVRWGDNGETTIRVWEGNEVVHVFDTLEGTL